MFTGQLEGSRMIEAELYDRLLAVKEYLDVYRLQPLRLTPTGELVTPGSTYFTLVGKLVNDWLAEHPCDRVFMISYNRDETEIDEWQRAECGWRELERGQPELKVSRSARQRLSPLAEPLTA
jgi:hypothetical protein